METQLVVIADKSVQGGKTGFSDLGVSVKGQTPFNFGKKKYLFEVVL